jgi:hypothetical protein
VRVSVAAEKAGIPATTFVIRSFVPQARVTAKGEGIQDIRIAEYPGAIQTHADADIDREIEAHTLDQIVAGLTGPAGEKEAEASGADLTESVFKGSFDEVNEFFSRRGWTDGLPIVPPTGERVDRFLKYSRLPADGKIAMLPLANQWATPRNIAVNAIMAGCRPEYMPVLLSAVEAMKEPRFRLRDLGNSCGCRPYLLVNGPITKRLDIYSGTGLMSPGARNIGSITAVNSNSTIGRALHLIVQNIAGFRPAISEMSVFGHQQSFVLAEDEEDSPWEPYHVEHGFHKNASTVTAMAWMGMIGQEGLSQGSKADLHLQYLGEELAHGMAPVYYSFGTHAMVTILIAPPIAKVLAGNGFSKRAVAEQIFERSRRTIREINHRLEPVYLTVHDYVVKGSTPKSFDLGPDETIPAVLSPDLIDIVVCGSRERNRSLILFSFYTNPVIKEIKSGALDGG